MCTSAEIINRCRDDDNLLRQAAQIARKTRACSGRNLWKSHGSREAIRSRIMPGLQRNSPSPPPHLSMLHARTCNFYARARVRARRGCARALFVNYRQMNRVARQQRRHCGAVRSSAMPRARSFTICWTIISGVARTVHTSIRLMDRLEGQKRVTTTTDARRATWERRSRFACCAAEEIIALGSCNI